VIYLDNAATTQIDPEVLEAMMPYLTNEYGNPGSLYSCGRKAREAVENARQQVAAFLNAEPEQIIFTSGGTEANNMVFTITQHLLEKSGRKRVAFTAIEHDSVIKAARRMKIKHGFDVTKIPVNTAGSASHMAISDYYINDSMGLISMMFSNNEIGAFNLVHMISEKCHEHGILFHTDCVQAAGYNVLDVKRIGCDYLTISSHKIHGPKGVGALFVKNPRDVEPMILGGANQEFGLRGGTENVAGIVGFGKACEISKQNHSEIVTKIVDLRCEFVCEFMNRMKAHGIDNRVSVNGDVYSGKTINLRVDGIEAETLLLMLDGLGICISSGSACNSRESVPSHVLKAIGLSDEQAASSFRISFSKMNTEEEVKTAAQTIADCINILLAKN
jgi:cysteine desulfurase